jgi:hypothetical protein
VKERKTIVLTNPTLNQMQALGLNGMATAWRELAEQDSAAELGRDEWLGLMLDRKVAMRRQARQESARCRQAALSRSLHRRCRLRHLARPRPA